jgi:hypothetical protein
MVSEWVDGRKLTELAVDNSPEGEPPPLSKLFSALR